MFEHISFFKKKIIIERWHSQNSFLLSQYHLWYFTGPLYLSFIGRKLFFSAGILEIITELFGYTVLEGGMPVGSETLCLCSGRRKTVCVMLLLSGRAKE